MLGGLVQRVVEACVVGLCRAGLRVIAKGADGELEEVVRLVGGMMKDNVSYSRRS